MKLKDRLLESLGWTAAALLIAGMVHIVSILLMPFVAPRDAYSRLAETAVTGLKTQGGVTLLKAVPPTEPPLPFFDPAMAQGVCFFDLGDGPLQVTASVDSDEYLGLSFHSATGVVFHAMTDHGANKGKIDIVLGDAKQIEDMEDEDSDDSPSEEMRVTAPSQRGFVLFRALARRPSDFERAQERLKAVHCETLKSE